MQNASTYTSSSLQFLRTHMQVNFLEAAGMILNDLSDLAFNVITARSQELREVALRTQRLQAFFSNQVFIDLLARVKQTMAGRGERAAGKLEIIIEPSGEVVLDSRRSNLQLHDQEQIRREVVKRVCLLQTQQADAYSNDYSLSLSL